MKVKGIGLPVNMVGNERNIDEYGKPLARKQKQNVDQNMKTILWQHQWVETVALVNGVLVVSLQFIKRNYLNANY